MYCYFCRSQSPEPTIVLLYALTSLDAFFRNQKGFATLLPIETHFDSSDFLRSSLTMSDLNKGHFLDSLGDFQSFGNQLCPRCPAVSRFRRHHFRRHRAFRRRSQNHFRSGNFHCPGDAFNHFPVRFFQATNITQVISSIFSFSFFVQLLVPSDSLLSPFFLAFTSCLYI